ncbi:MAG: glycosyltransferase family 2 protein [Oscillospiraceae bacterium]|nr:glycosyltransferase family 2 protein [Oscillospiraceae bacterium]
MAKVSVIIPVYNAEKYLEKCVRSVMDQTLRDIEIICVDDGSPDNSLEVLKKLRAEDDRVKIISQPNGGAGAARNNGLRNASGEYLSFLDADDFFEPNMLEEAVNAADKYRADFVVFNSDQYHMDKDAFVAVPWVLRTMDIPPYMPFNYRQLTDNVFKTFVGWAWDKLYRRSFVMEHDIWYQEQRTTNDMLFVFTALVTAKRIAIVNKVLAHQRRGGSESLSVTREKSWYCFYDALTALRKRLEDEDIFWELEKDYINYALHFCLWNMNTLAEPTHQLLQDKLTGEWFEALGIKGKPESYFYNRGEYAQYKKLMKL